MKNTTTLSLLAILLIMAGCAPKEAFFFPKSAGSFGSAQKTQDAAVADPNTTSLSSLRAIPEDDTGTEAVPLTAAAGPMVIVPVAGQAAKGALHPPANQQPVSAVTDAGEHYKTLSATYQTAPKGKKNRMHGTVEAGFALSLFGVVSILLVFITPYLLFFSGLLTFTGLVLSFIGLLKVTKNKDKLRGKVRALIGILLGLLGTALVLILLNNNF